MRKVLFICVENAGRSQMAVAFFNFYAKDSDFIAESSGTIPAKQVNPTIVEVMREKNIDVKGAYPKRFNPDDIGQYRRVISFGCLIAGTFSQEVQNKIEDWVINDPRNKPIVEVRKIRDKIEDRVKELFQSLSYKSS